MRSSKLTLNPYSLIIISKNTRHFTKSLGKEKGIKTTKVALKAVVLQITNPKFLPDSISNTRNHPKYK